jgi:hypothetical protein
MYLVASGKIHMQITGIAMLMAPLINLPDSGVLPSNVSSVNAMGGREKDRSPFRTAKHRHNSANLRAKIKCNE